MSNAKNEQIEIEQDVTFSVEVFRRANRNVELPSWHRTHYGIIESELEAINEAKEEMDTFKKVRVVRNVRTSESTVVWQT